MGFEVYPPPTVMAPTVRSTVENLKVIRGIVTTTTPTIDEGAGFTISKNGTGDVTVTFSSAFSDVPSVTVSTSSIGYVSGIYTISASAVRCVINQIGVGNQNGTFYFIAVGPV